MNNREKLRKLRRSKHLSMKQLASCLRCDTQQISRLESGNRKISELWARRIGEYFGVHWTEFMEKDETI